jgi:hypothetical protein
MSGQGRSLPKCRIGLRSAFPANRFGNALEVSCAEVSKVDRSNKFQPRPNRSLSVVFMGLRVA